MPIKFNQVSYIYSKNTPVEQVALNNVCLSIEEKSFSAIVGKTGCGKSTLIQHINGLLKPTSGDVRVDEFVITSDKKYKNKKINLLRKKVGIVFQFPEYQLFEKTVMQDVMFGPLNFDKSVQNAEKKAQNSIKMVGLDETFYERVPFELSGGEKRKVAIAGILAMEPNILILDEPTAGLDPKSTSEMMNLFKQINESGVQVVIVTHDMDIVYKYANNIIILDNGEVAKVVTHDELYRIDFDKYSLAKPKILEMITLLDKNGVQIDKKNVRDAKSLASEIKRCLSE